MSKDPDPLDAFVGARIRHRRVALGIPRHQFAKRLGITQQEVDQYELGIRRIGSQRLFHIARTIEVDIDFFFCPLIPW
jgi:transcriptional regulator with XRE-family HTH domain